MIEKVKIDEIVNKIASVIKPKRIILFGSYAVEKANDESDLDLLVVVEDIDLPQHKRARGIRKHLWGITDIPKDIIVYTEKEIKEWQGVKSSFISNVLEYGKVVYEN
jgi:predicted nucleotidyltransferase